jgi:hypothetical protein
MMRPYSTSTKVANDERHARDDGVECRMLIYIEFAYYQTQICSQSFKMESQEEESITKQILSGFSCSVTKTTH